MKATLVFDLPEEEEDFNLAVKAIHYKIVLDDVDNHLRGKLKYSELTQEVYDALSEVRSFLLENKNQRGLE
jgi:hypothetical protein